MKKGRVEEIKRDVEREFPNDFALQQVHIARKLLAEEAKEKGINIWEYINTGKRGERRFARCMTADTRLRLCLRPGPLRSPTSHVRKPLSAIVGYTSRRLNA